MLSWKNFGHHSYVPAPTYPVIVYEILLYSTGNNKTLLQLASASGHKTQELYRYITPTEARSKNQPTQPTRG